MNDNLLYGSVEGLSRRADTLYGSERGRARYIQKLYGEVNGKAKLTYVNLGEIPRPGILTYYTDTTYTTTKTVRIRNQTELEWLCNTLSSWATVIDGQPMLNTAIKEVILPTWATSVPDNFLRGCSRLTDVTLPSSVTSIGNYFLNDCSSLNGSLDLFYVENVGMNFLDGCSSFNQPLDTSNLTEFPDSFMAGCSSFSQPIETAQATNFGRYFLKDCHSFNQQVVVSSDVESVGTGFLYNCYDMVSPIICNAPASVALVSDETFSVDDDTQDAYTQGVQIGGLSAQDWKTKFPSRTTNPFRNTGFASTPVLYDLEVSENDNSEILVNYGVSVWDLNGQYTSGTVSLSESVGDSAFVVLESKTTTGLNTTTRTNVAGNTKYSYKVEATNSGNESLEIEKTIITKPAIFTISVVDSGYEVFNVFKRTFTLSLPANGNTLPQVVEYRIKKTSESSFGNWVNVGTYYTPYANSVDAEISFETDNDYTIEFRVSTEAGNRTVVYNQPSIPSHQGPSGVVVELGDANTEIQTWLSSFEGYEDGTWFISGKSQPSVSIENPGTTSDGASLVEYDVFVTNPDDGYSATIPYVEGQVLSHTFEEGSIASLLDTGNVEVRVDARDSLNAVSQVQEQGVYMSWVEPAQETTIERVAETGGIRITFAGAFSGLVTSGLNQGRDMNMIHLQFRVLDYAGGVITDWTDIPSGNITVTQRSGTNLNREFSGSFMASELDYVQSVVVQVKYNDEFATLPIIEKKLSAWDEGQVLDPVNYEIELWDWKSSTFVADISYLVSGDLSITWTLNDVEEVNFEIDLLEFEAKCAEMRIDPSELLKPYSHDIRIRRNGVYILGCQLVEANVKLTNDPPATIEIRGTGFLNLLKDQYILGITWAGYSYAEIAKKLVETAQKPDCLIKNPTCDIDISYWLAANGTVSYSTNDVHSGSGCIMGSRSGTGWITFGTQLNCDAGTNFRVDLWLKSQAGELAHVKEREHITDPGGQQTVCSFTANGQWQHVVADAQTWFDHGYIVVEFNRTNTTSVLRVDDMFVYEVSDDASLCDMKIKQGIDTASGTQEKTRQVSYELQNVKDALVDLTSLESDNFDFDFSYDRTFNLYTRKGADKTDLEICYPGNIESMNISRSAADLANKVINIGSGIGDERMQVSMVNNASRAKLGTRESVMTSNNVVLQESLISKAVGELYDRKDPTDLPSIIIKDGSVNPSNVGVGDTIYPIIEDDAFLGTANQPYRIQRIQLTVEEDGVENMNLTVEKPLERPVQKTVRYIRNSIQGSTVSGQNHWVQIQAMMLEGNKWVNVALNKPVYVNFPMSDPNHANPQVVTNGNTSSDNHVSDNRGGQVGAVTIDLGAEYPLDHIKVRHYYADGRAYYNNILSIGNSVDSLTGSAPLETVLWNYTNNGDGDTKIYGEISSGHKSKWIQGDNVTEEYRNVRVRYIRESHLNSSASLTNIWADIRALRKKADGAFENVALGKTVYCSGVVSDGNVNNIVDGDPITHCSVGNSAVTRNAVTIDLGGEYDLDYIKLIHFIGTTYGSLPDRTFYGSHLSVGNKIPDSLDGTEDLEIVLWADGSGEGVVETYRGRPSRWIQGVI